MNSEELAGAVLPGQEGTPPSAPASQGEPAQPVETTPPYLTRAEALELQRRLAQAEGMTRGLQSVLDRIEAKEQATRQVTTLVKGQLEELVRDGVLDETTAAEYVRRAQMKATFEPPVQQQPAAVGAIAQAGGVHPLIEKAQAKMAAKGIYPGDPEYTDPLAFDNPLDWMDALEKAVAMKQARMVREQARQSQGTPPPAPVNGAPGAAAVDMSPSTGAATADTETLRKQLRDAYRHRDRAAIDRLNSEIERVAGRGG